MFRLRRLFIFFVVFISSHSYLFSIQPVAFSRLLLHPRVIALGNTGSVSTNGASALGFNPALTYYGPNVEFGAYFLEFVDTTYGLIEARVVWRGIPFVVSGRLAHFGPVVVSQLNETTSLYTETAEFISYKAYQWRLGTSYEIFNHGLVGFSIVHISEYMYGFSSGGWGLDVGAYKPYSWGGFGVVCHHLIRPRLDWSTQLGTSYILNRVYSVGITREFFLKHVAVYGQLKRQQAVTYHVGVAVKLAAEFFVHAGLDNGTVTAGSELVFSSVSFQTAWKQFNSQLMDAGFFFGLVWRPLFF